MSTTMAPPAAPPRTRAPFTGEVVVRQVEDDPEFKRWELVEPLSYRGKHDEWTVPPRLRTDFRLGPRVVTWLIPRYGRYTAVRLDAALEPRHAVAAGAPGAAGVARPRRAGPPARGGARRADPRRPRVFYLAEWIVLGILKVAALRRAGRPRKQSNRPRFPWTV